MVSYPKSCIIAEEESKEAFEILSRMTINQTCMQFLKKKNQNHPGPLNKLWDRKHQSHQPNLTLKVYEKHESFSLPPCLFPIQLPMARQSLADYP